jgi:hypothetical protein
MHLKTVSLILITIAAYLFGNSDTVSRKDFETDTVAKLIEGTISSINIENNELKMNATIFKQDTFHLDKNAVIKAGGTVADRGKLQRNVFVKAQYKILNNQKFATVVVTRPQTGFLPDTTELGNSALIAEGAIHFINQDKNLMVIQASLEREYIFSLDSSAIIKSGIRPVPLRDLKPHYTAKVSYTEKDSKKVIQSITTKQ